MSIPISLLQMPEVPMKHILEYLEFPSILVLRKVCHDLRNFIDDTKSASRLEKIRIDVYPKQITFALCPLRSPCSIRIEYLYHWKGCSFECHRDGKVKKTIVEDEDFVTVFCKEFDSILRHQKTVLDDLIIKLNYSHSPINNRVLESANISLKSMNPPLQVNALHMGLEDINEILSILPYIDPKPLEHILIFSERSCSVLNLNKIGQLEQWKQADELTIYGFQLQNAAQNLKHFLDITLHLRKISIKELILLKEIFLCSTTLTSMDISYNCNSSSFMSQRLIEAFGQPSVDSDQDKRSWFFRFPGTNQFLRITQKGLYTDFICIEQSDVPQNALILN